MEKCLIKNNDHFAIILSGGSGTRLWPYSRVSKPKQFLNFGDNLTLFQKTVSRVSKFYRNQNIFIITNKEFYYETKGQLSDIGKNDIKIVLEPYSKNTLPAISYGVKKIHEINNSAIIGVFSSDHSIEDDDKFISSCEEASRATVSNSFVIFGIQPTEANTGYGYIKLGKPFPQNSTTLFNVDSFIEKPDLNNAKKYIKKGYLWNSGMFFFNLDAYLKNLKIQQNVLYKCILDSNENDLLDNYKNLPSISIDYGLLEKLKEILVVKVSFTWTDLGSWNSIHSFMKNDEKNNNTVIGNVISKDNENTFIMSNERLVASFGLKNLIIINDIDSTLICHKDKADDLKALLELVGLKNNNYLNNHPEVNRPWGRYRVLYESKTFKIKSIVVNPKQQLSLQLHQYRNEHWVVVKGKAQVTNGNQRFVLNENESTYIERNVKHRLANDQAYDLEVIEVSIGEKIEETDIVRFDDDYKRKNI